MTVEQIYAVLGEAAAHNVEDCMRKDRSLIDEQLLKNDDGKPCPTLVPLRAIWDIAEVREYGVKKYGSRESWRSVSVERYRDALFRHLLKYLADPHGVDEESGIKHYKHLLCNAAFIAELEDGNNET